MNRESDSWDSYSVAKEAAQRKYNELGERIQRSLNELEETGPKSLHDREEARRALMERRTKKLEEHAFARRFSFMSIDNEPPLSDEHMQRYLKNSPHHLPGSRSIITITDIIREHMEHRQESLQELRNGYGPIGNTSLVWLRKPDGREQQHPDAVPFRGAVVYIVKNKPR